MRKERWVFTRHSAKAPAPSWRHGEAIVPIFIDRGAPLGVNLYFGAAPVAPASSPMFVKALPAK